MPAVELTATEVLALRLYAADGKLGAGWLKKNATDSTALEALRVQMHAGDWVARSVRARETREARAQAEAAKTLEAWADRNPNAVTDALRAHGVLMPGAVDWRTDPEMRAVVERAANATRGGGSPGGPVTRAGSLSSPGPAAAFDERPRLSVAWLNARYPIECPAGKFLSRHWRRSPDRLDAALREARDRGEAIPGYAFEHARKLREAVGQ